MRTTERAFGPGAGPLASRATAHLGDGGQGPMGPVVVAMMVLLVVPASAWAGEAVCK
jgi:hypothetical protein